MRSQTVRVALAAALAGSAALAQAAGLGSNLVVNGGAESGLSGWQRFDGVASFSAVDYGPNWVLPTQPGPTDRGAGLFAGGSGVAYAAGYQDLDLAGIPGLGSTALNVALGGWLGGWLTQTDEVKVTAQFMDPSGSVIGLAVLGPTTADDRGGETGLSFFESATTMPIGTHSIRLIMEMTRFEGGDNDGYADNLSFVITAVPEPGSPALALLGVATLLTVRQRRGR